MQELASIITSIFFGFSVLNIIFLIVRKLTSNPKLGTKAFDLADKITIWNGIIFLILFLGQELLIYLVVQESNSKNELGLTVNSVGPYFPIVITSLLTVISSQLFRLEMVKESNLYRLLFSLIILFTVKFESLIIIATSLHRDHVLPSISYFKRMFIEWSIELVVFSGIFLLVFLVKNKRS